MALQYATAAASASAASSPVPAASAAGASAAKTPAPTIEPSPMTTASKTPRVRRSSCVMRRTLATGATAVRREDVFPCNTT